MATSRIAQIRVPHKSVTRQMQEKAWAAPAKWAAPGLITPTFLIESDGMVRNEEGKQTGTTVLDKGENT